jgi:uncharacterized membrane protein
MQINKSNSRILSNENKITTMSEQLQNPNTKIVERDTNIQIHDHLVTKYYTSNTQIHDYSVTKYYTSNTQIHDYSITKYYTSSSGKVHYFHSLVW